MRKRDINGNTVSTNTAVLLTTISNMTAGSYTMDSVGYVMVDTPRGGHIIFHSGEFPHAARHVQEVMTLRQ
jgi:hypothetical protein